MVQAESPFIGGAQEFQTPHPIPEPVEVRPAWYKLRSFVPRTLWSSAPEN